jgi:hypothetical protein
VRLAEWLAEFRSDIQGFVTREAVEACMTLDVRERAPMQSVWYYAFADPSGGSADSMTLAVGHREKDVIVLDDARLLVQLVGLERRTARGGRDSFDHAPPRARRPGERGSRLSGCRQARVVRQP